MATSSDFEGANGGLSMLEKSLERRRVNKEHNSNFRAGHVPINEEHLHKTGLRGRKRFFAYVILALVFIAAIANLLMTIAIMLVLNINWDGLQPMTFLGNGLLRFNDPVDIDEIYTTTGQLGGYKAQDLTFTAMEGASVQFENTARSGSSLKVNGEETVLVSSHGFEVHHPDTGKQIFRVPGVREEMAAPAGDYKTFKASAIITPSVQSDSGEDLQIDSDATVTLQGNEGLDINSKQINMQADVIELRPQSNLVLQGGANHGVYINTTLLDKSSGSGSATTYKLCVCDSTGLVFRVQATGQYSCANLDAAQNPCIV